MVFHYKPITGGDLFDVAQRLAEPADLKLAATRDLFAWEAEQQRGWAKVVELGWPAMLVGEDFGGAGAGLAEAAALVEGAGRYALAQPVIKACVLAPLLLSACAGPVRDQMLVALAAGEATVIPVLDAVQPWSGARGGARLKATPTDDGLELSGQLLGVELAAGVSHLLIAVGDELLLLAADAAGLEQNLHRRIDGRVAADLLFDRVAIPAEYRLGGGPATTRAVTEALDVAALLACIEVVAGMATVIEQTVAYLQNRVQFGVALSTLQVLRHYTADIYVAFQNSHALTAHALRQMLEVGPADAWRDIAMAKLRVGEAARFAMETSVQLHGGMGMTEETLASRIGKHLLMNDLDWGDRMHHAQRVLTDANRVRKAA